MSIKNAELREYEKILLDILANNLFNAGRTVNLTDEDLNAVWCEAYAQAVILMAFHNSDYKNLSEEKCVYIRKKLSQTLADNAKVDFEHVRICSILKNAGIPCTILKGFASALYYSDPLMRSMGDVDFLVDTDNFEAANRVLLENGYQPTGKNHDVHDIYLGSVCRCEMHFQPSGIPEGKAGVKVRKYLSGLLENSEKIQTELGEIIVPSIFHHGLIILLHMCHHLTGDGLGIRHLCDWAVFLDKIGEEKFLELFEKPIKDIGLWDFAKIMTYISCKYLGLKEMSFAKDADKELADYILIDIIIGGNFGQKKADRSHESLLISSKNEEKVSMFRQFFISANNIVYHNWTASKKFKILIPIGWIFFGGRYLIRSVLGKRPKVRPNKVAKHASERIDIYSRLNLFSVHKKR
ncbi:MAG: nucleotidyltransferase family protein [Clostridia bacterium]|nr:nucleotidyltransferase family protein [Clostridia bacterium]